MTTANGCACGLTACACRTLCPACGAYHRPGENTLCPITLGGRPSPALDAALADVARVEAAYRQGFEDARRLGPDQGG